MLARASVETLFVGLYCLRIPEAIAELHAGNIKALGDTLAYVEEAGVVPVDVVRKCAEALGAPRRRYLGPWEMVAAIDEVNGNKSARSIYRRLYAPLSNFTVHASGGTLMRHVRRGTLSPRPSRTWNRRSPARVADAAAGLLAADLAQRAGKPHDQLLGYAEKHLDRTLMPMAVMAFSGLAARPGRGASARPSAESRTSTPTFGQARHPLIRLRSAPSMYARGSRTCSTSENSVSSAGH